jgi:hypothetical protein
VGALDVTDQSQPQGGSRWRYVRFSIRGLIILVLVIGCGFGWIVRMARIQRDAVAAIENTGGHAWYDWEETNRESDAHAPPWWPAWLVERVGVDYFGHVVAVGVGSTKGSDADLAQVGRLGRLEQLSLNGTSVTDSGMTHLKGLTGLKLLELETIKITDAGVRELHQARPDLVISR